ERALVFLPRRDIRVDQRTERELLARAILFESRAHHIGIAILRDDDREQALAVAPADAGEIEQRRAPGEQDRVDLLRRHDPPRGQGARGRAGRPSATTACGECDMDSQNRSRMPPPTWTPPASADTVSLSGTVACEKVMPMPRPTCGRGM